MEAGKKRLAGDTVREASSDEVSDLRIENRDLKELVANLLFQNNHLKKSIAKSTFFKWYKAYRDKGLVGLTPMPPGNRRQ